MTRIILINCTPRDTDQIKHIDLKEFLNSTNQIYAKFEAEDQVHDQPQGWRIAAYNEDSTLEGDYMYDHRADYENDVKYLQLLAKDLDKVVLGDKYEFDFKSFTNFKLRSLLEDGGLVNVVFYPVLYQHKIHCKHWDGVHVETFDFPSLREYEHDLTCLKVMSNNEKTIAPEKIVLKNAEVVNLEKVNHIDLTDYLNGVAHLNGTFVAHGRTHPDLDYWQLYILNHDGELVENINYSSERSYNNDLAYLRSLKPQNEKDMTDQEKLITVLEKLQTAWQGVARTIEEVNLPEVYSEKYPFSEDLTELIPEINTWVNAVKYDKKSAPDVPKTHCCTTSIDQSVNFSQLLKIDWKNITDIVINPKVALGKNEECLSWENIDIAEDFQPANLEVDFISCWSVEIFNEEDLWQVIGDFKDEAEAREFEQFITKKLLPHIRKTVEFVVKCKIGQNLNIDSLQTDIERALKNSSNVSALVKDLTIEQKSNGI